MIMENMPCPEEFQFWDYNTGSIQCQNGWKALHDQYESGLLYTVLNHTPPALWCIGLFILFMLVWCWKPRVFWGIAAAATVLTAVKHHRDNEHHDQ